MNVEQPPIRSALVVVDLQHGTVSGPSAHPTSVIVANCTALADRFRKRELPVVVATVTGTPAGATSYAAGPQSFPDDWIRAVPDFVAHHSDITVRRAAWSVFAHTDLDEQLRAVQVNHVVIAGIATSFGVESSARAAYDLGYTVTVVADATTDPTREAHEHTLQRTVPALGTVKSTAVVLAELGL